MTQQITTTIPDGHTQHPTCPHCHEPIDDQLHDRFPDSDPADIGGELACVHCDGCIVVSVFRPSAVFDVQSGSWYPEGVVHIRSGRQ